MAFSNTGSEHDRRGKGLHPRNDVMRTLSSWAGALIGCLEVVNKQKQRDCFDGQRRLKREAADANGPSVILKGVG
jgi:hypothetical protein